MTVPARLENLKTVQSLIMEDSRIPGSVRKKLCLAAEEVFVNICSYAYEGAAGTADITLEISDRITMIFQDNGKPFNPLEHPVDIGDYNIDTQVGGLGRLIAFDFVDDVRYEYKDQKNVLTLTKRFI